MKISKLIVIVAAAAVMASCSSGPEGSKETRALFPTSTEIDSASYLLGVNFGMMIKQYNFEGLDYSKVLSGLKDAAESKGNPMDSTFVDQFDINPMEMGSILDGYLEKLSTYKSALNGEKGKEFIENYMKEEGVQVTESGIAYKIIEAGEDNPTSLQDTVLVNYVGTFIDGEQFDSNDEITFPLNGVIAGWGEGLQLIGKGGEIELVIPGELAYGEYGGRGIEPNTTLKFHVNLLDVKHYVEPAAEEEANDSKKK